MRILLIRHGRPENEGIQRYIGTTDVPLSETGRYEVCQSGCWIREHYPGIRTIYTSPLIRCYESARILSEITSARIVVSDELREIHLGSWEGLTKEEVKRRFPAEFKERGRCLWTFHIPGGESFLEAGQRFRRAVIRIAGEQEESGREEENTLTGCASGPKVLAVTHAGVLGAWMSLVQGSSSERILHDRIPFAGMVLAEISGERTEILRSGLLPGREENCS